MKSNAVYEKQLCKKSDKPMIKYKEYVLRISLIALMVIIALTVLIFTSCNENSNPSDGSGTMQSTSNSTEPQDTTKPLDTTEPQDTTVEDTTQEPDQPIENLKVYVDMNFDDVENGADIPGVTQEGAGFKVIKDDKGNGWAVAKSPNEWASFLFDAHDENGEKVLLKDFCFETKVYLPYNNKGVTNDGGISMCVAKNDRYDVCLYWGKSSSAINVYQASDTNKGTVADNVDPNKGHVSYFMLFPGQKYVFTIIGKYRQDENGNEWIRLTMFIDNQRALEYEIPYWEGGFALRGWQSAIQYDYVKVTEIPSVFPDGTPYIPPSETVSNISVDFSTREGLPLFKRQSYCIENTQQFAEYAYHLLELRARSARFMLTNGAASTNELDIIAYMKKTMSTSTSFGEILRKYSTPFWYIRQVNAAIDPEAQKKDPANAVWYEPIYSIWNPIWTGSAEYMANKDMRSFYEVWNEPDQTYWTRFDWDGYIRMYRNTVTALRKGDKNAFVGGPAMSSLNTLGEDNFKKFLDTLSAENLPLDFYSMHSYETGATLLGELDRVREGLMSYEAFKTTQIIYSEYNVYIPLMEEWTIPFEQRTDFTLQSSRIVPDALSTIMDLNRYTDVTQVQWAWLLLENGSFALVDSWGNRSPLYHALYAYAHMPTDAVKMENSSNAIQITASADSVSAAALLWNRAPWEEETEVVLNNIPFTKYDVTIYRIDSAHSSYYETGNGDEFEAVETFKGCTSSSFTWEGKIPGSGTVYITITTGETPELDRHSSVGDIIRSDNYFENREQNSYSDFDDLTSTALIGTGDNKTARGLVAVTYTDVKDKIQVSGSLPYNDIKQINNSSSLGVRIDYHTRNGYTKSVLYAIMAPKSENERVYPFGTCEKPDVVYQVDISGFEMDIKGNAPEGWDGQIIISFDIEDTGKWTEAKFKME